jgi:hypothetical protein
LVGGALRTRNHTRNLPLKALNSSLQYLQQILKTLRKNWGLNYHCQHQKKTAESEDETQKLQYYLRCWQGHPADFIVESTMQHCCLLASQGFSHHAKTPCVSGLSLTNEENCQINKEQHCSKHHVPIAFLTKHCCGALILYPK